MKRVIYACLLTLVIVTCAQLAPAQSDWPMFRKDCYNSGRSAYAGPGQELSWSYTAGGAIKSAPVIGIDGSIYFACSDGYLYAIAGGEMLKWPTLCNCSGKISPAVGPDGTIYIGGTDNFLYAYNPDKSIKWKKSSQSQITSSIIIVNGNLYFGCTDGKLRAFDSGGNPIWTNSSVGGVVTSTPAFSSDGSTLYVGSQTGFVFAIKASDGTQKWKYPSTTAEGGNFIASPTIDYKNDGSVYIGSTSGNVYVIKPTGVGKRLTSLYGGIVSSIAITASNTIYAGANDGKLYAINTLNGSMSWSKPIGTYVNGSPAVCGDDSVSIASTDGTIYSFDSAGNQRWSYNAGSPIYSSPAIGPGGELLIGADNGKIYCFGADKTPPSAPGPITADRYTCYSNHLYATWDSAQDSESGISNYEMCVGTSAGSNNIADWTKVGSATSATLWGLALQDKQTYYIGIRAINGAGLTGPAVSSGGITVDLTPPSTPAVIGAGPFTSDPTSLSASWSSVDPESGIKSYSYSISTTRGGNNILDWTNVNASTSVTKVGLSLNSGTTYYINVKAYNNAGGISSIGSTAGTTVDTTPPDAPVVTDDGQYISDPHSIHARWAASDTDSGISQYEYSVGTSAGGTQIKSWTSAGTSTDLTISGLNLTNGGTYFINVRATNGAGIVSAVGSSDGATLDATPPSTPAVIDDGAYTASLTELHATWTSADAESGITGYKYAIGTTRGGTDIVPWTDVSTATSIDRTDLTLTHKQIYYISVIAINGAGGQSAVGSTDGITVDATPPTKPVVTDDGAVTIDHSQLHATWTTADAESGIAKIEYSIGDSAGASNVVDWTSVGTATSVTKTGLTLLDGVRYYINVRATNTVGLVSDIGSSDGILVDSTPPPAPTVTDDGTYTTVINTLHAKWTSVTSTSPIKYYEYSIGTSAGATDTKDWTNADMSNEVTVTGLSLQSGKTYYFNVRATNNLNKIGNVGSSDGITVDTSAPSKPTVTDGGVYTSSSNQLTASWSATDPESSISLYEYAVGTSPNGTNVLNWTSAGAQTSATIGSLSLVDGTTYYISVRATNGAGLMSQIGTSDGIKVDLSAPSTPTVTDDGAYATSATQLHATWSSSDAQSGISKYEYSIGTSAGATDTLGWTSAGTAVEMTITGLSLRSGTRYYINVRATNGAGLVSQVGSTDGILVDTTPPTTPAVTDDGKYTRSTNTLHATWTSQDPDTNITGYEYSIGTSAGGTNFVGWTSIGTATSVNRTDLSLSNGVTYYINVRATNAAGLVSSVGSSDGITVDTTPPPAPTVTDDGVYTSNTTQLHVKVACTDNESGIASYDYAVGTTPNGTDIIGWKSDGAGPDITITGLSLQTGVTYYVSARATNGAGITGNAGTSDGIKVDNTGPVGLTVTDDGNFTGSSNSLHGSWTANDPESGIAKYKYCIGTTTGSNNVADWLDVGAATEHTRTGLSLANGQTYYITVIATNGAGGSSAPVSSNGIRVDLTPPTTPAVTDSGKYWGYKTSLWASWGAQDQESGIAEYQVSAGTSAGAVDIAPWQSVGNITSYTLSGLHLSDGVTYYINVKAKNGAGIWGSVGSSDGVMIDSTPPTTPVVTDDGDTTSVLDRLHATWHSTDLESGIAEYFYCIGTSPGGTDVVDWKSAGMNEEVTVTGLTLDPVLRYYFSVKARSGAGAWSPVAASDGIGYTSGAAIWARFHNDQYNTGRGLFNATQVNNLAWSVMTQGYVESSPAIAVDGTTYIGSADGKLYAITQNGGNRWTVDLKAAVFSSPAIANDGRIVVGTDDGKVYCLNNLGQVQWSYKTNNVIQASPLIKDGVVYVGSTDGLLYAINLDTGLKIWSYDTKSMIWGSPAIDASGVIYIGSQDTCVYAINSSGKLKWKFPTGSYVMASPAIGSDGTIYVGSADGGFYAIRPDGTKKWRLETGSAIDSSAAIGPDGNIYFGNGYEGSDGVLYAVRPDGSLIWGIPIHNGGMLSSPAIDPSGTIYVGTCDNKVYAFKSDRTKVWEYATGDFVISSPALGADGSVVFGSYDGKVYCLRDATSKDLTPPTKPIVTVSSMQLLDDPVHASWKSSDPESMVAEYTYAIGTTPGGTDIAGWTSTGVETQISRDDLILRAGLTYYVSVKARNPSQRWSDIGVSNPVTVVAEAQIGTIGALKMGNNGDSVSLTGKTVTGVFPDCFFVEETDRTSGIRCIQASSGLQTGDLVDINGTLNKNDGEWVISSATHVPAGSSTPLKPLGISGRAVKATRPDPLGLEVTIWGRVTAVGDGYCVIDDGSNIQSVRGVKGIEIKYLGSPVSVGKSVAATGIMCLEQVNGQSVTVLRLLSAGSLLTLN